LQSLHCVELAVSLTGVTRADDDQDGRHLHLSSRTLQDNGVLPEIMINTFLNSAGANTCTLDGSPGGNESPELSWSNAPPETRNLVYLGINQLRASPAAGVAARPIHAPPGRLFRDGFFVALLNPKTALFFAALLPQFINPGASPLGQSLALGCVFVSIAMCTDTLYVLTASALAPAHWQRSRWRQYSRYVAAATFIGLGLYAALTNPRTAK